MSIDLKYAPVVAIEVNGLLGTPLAPALATQFLSGTGAEITFRRDAYPSRFLSEPRWDENGELKQRWAFLGRGVQWVKGLIASGVEVVWASRYQEFANIYFGPTLGLPELPVAARDDGRSHTTEAEWKASQLRDSSYAGRPLLWVNDELTTAGRYLLERARLPAMRALTWSQYIPDSASDDDVRFMDGWLELAKSPAGHRELREMRSRFTRKRRGRGFSDERLYREWVEIRTRLENVLDFRSGLAAPLAAYAVDHAGHLDVRVVARIREEWGIYLDPPVDELMRLLEA